MADKDEAVALLKSEDDIETKGKFTTSAQTLEKLFEVGSTEESMQNLKGMEGPNGVMQRLVVSKTSGVPTLDEFFGVDARKDAFGANTQVEREVASFWDLCKEQLGDRVLQILCAAAVVSMIVGSIDNPETGFIDGIGIFCAVFIVVLVGASNDYAKDRKFRALYAASERREVTVVRDGRIFGLSIFDLVVGDLIHINAGEKLPVDGILIEGNGLVIDESSLTGEPYPVKKGVPTFREARYPNPILYSGTEVIEGSGLMLTCAVGERSVTGKMRSRLTEESDPTPLQEKLEVLADDIGKGGLALAVVICTFLIVKMVFVAAIAQDLTWGDVFGDLIEYIILGITVIVIAVPEGLPVAVVISLAYSVGKMEKENNLVRHLQASEIMGSCTDICSDKTGTLTQNKMMVVTLNVEDNNCESVHEHPVRLVMSDETKGHLARAVACNSTAFISRGEIVTIDENTTSTGVGPWIQRGNRTECALLQMTSDLGDSYLKTRESYPAMGVIPFNSIRKRMTTVVRNEENPDEVFVYTKGAGEIILDLCSGHQVEDGVTVELTAEKKEALHTEIIIKNSLESLRTITLAYKVMPIDEFEDLDLTNEEDRVILESDLTLLAIAGIQDPLRPDVPDAIAQCKKSGIRVRMVTGDNLEIAIAISKKAGILDETYRGEDPARPYQCMEGKKFRELVGGLVPKVDDDKNEQGTTLRNMEVFAQIADQLDVLARSSPEDKYMLTTGLKELGHVVAVTGDGTNDAPALKKADVGFAMGICGTEVAKEAADIILMDDSFKSIVTSIKWGRNIFDCVRKFMQFQMTINMVALPLLCISAWTLDECPITTVQMLWINLIQDSFAALALATEPPSTKLLDREPYKRSEHMFTGTMIKNILVQSIFQVGVLTTMLFWPGMLGVDDSYGNNKNGEWERSEATHYTMIFHAFVFMQIFNELNCRKIRNEEKNVFSGFFNNPMFLAVICGSAISQILIVTFGGAIFGCARLSIVQHLSCAAIGTLVLPVDLISKIIPDSSVKCITP